MQDYVSHLTERAKTKGEMLHYGIRGMKWGVRRTDAQIAKDVVARKSKGEEVTATEKAKQALSSQGTESASQKYARMTAEAKAGGSSNWSDADLKFYTSRSAALNKVNKKFNANPGWLSTTSKKVMQNAAQKAMQDLANGITNKYITSKALEAINNDTAAKLRESSTPVDYVGRRRAKPNAKK